MSGAEVSPMFYECSGCQAVMSFRRHPQAVCPECGMAGVMFCLLDDEDMADLRLRELDFSVTVQMGDVSESIIEAR
jgi:hypothetical protein